MSQIIYNRSILDEDNKCIEVVEVWSIGSATHAPLYLLVRGPKSKDSYNPRPDIEESSSKLYKDGKRAIEDAKI